jgi:hypothetical protein
MVLVFAIFQIVVCLLSECDSIAQSKYDLIYNFNEPIKWIGADLKKINIMEFNSTLLSISNIEANCTIRNNVPKDLNHFLVKKKIITSPENMEQNKDVLLVAKYVYSTHYNSYILMISEDFGYEQIKKDLYLINVKKDQILSVFHAASYLNGEGHTAQRYSINSGRGIFDQFYEEISSDVEYLEKGRSKEDNIKTSRILISIENGKASIN